MPLLKLRRFLILETLPVNKATEFNQVNPSLLGPTAEKRNTGVHHSRAPQASNRGVHHRREPQTCTTGVHHRCAPEASNRWVHQRCVSKAYTADVHHRQSGDYEHLLVFTFMNSLVFSIPICLVICQLFFSIYTFFFLL